MAKAQKGDLIRVVDASITYGSYSNGDIFEVIKREHFGVLVNAYWKGDEETEDNRISINDHEYEIHRKAGEEDSPKTSVDAVNPQHYKQGRTEVIDIIEDAVTGADPFEAVCQANVLKYTLRYRHKNGVEDLKKAVWYAEKLIEHLTQK